MSASILSQADYKAILQYTQPVTCSPIVDTRQLRKAASDLRVSKWSNTISACKVQQENDRINQKLLSETKQLQQDEMERLYQQRERDELINRSVQAKYNSIDRVQQFNQALKLSDLHSDRQKQIQYKLQQLNDEKEQDIEWQKKYVDSGIQHDALQRELQLSRKQQQSDIQHMQQLQLHERQLHKQLIKNNIITEGKRLKQIDLELQQQQSAAEHEKRLHKLRTNQSYIDCNKQQLLLQKQRQAQESIQLERINKFACERDQRVADRRAAELSIKQLKQSRINELIDRQVDNLSAIHAADTQRLQQQIHEFEVKQAYIEKSKAERAAEIGADIQYSRQQQQFRKQQERERIELIEKELMNKWSLDNQACIESDAEKLRLAALKRQQVAADLLQQIHENDEKKKIELMNERHEYMKQLEFDQAEENKFNDYVSTQFNQLKLDNKSTIPAALALRKIQNSNKFTKR